MFVKRKKRHRKRKSYVCPPGRRRKGALALLKSDDKRGKSANWISMHTRSVVADVLLDRVNARRRCAIPTAAFEPASGSSNGR
jgi:hypothetical protein